jgi:polysaccharide biosynthesis transport protein
MAAEPLKKTIAPEASFGETIAQVLVYCRLLLKHKWQILVGTFALTLIFTVIIAKWPNIYEATATILVDPQQIPEKYVSAAVDSDRYARLNTITQQVLTGTRLKEIINKFNLYQEGRKSESSQEAIEQMRNDMTIEEVTQQGSGQELSTFTLAYHGKEPKLVADVANELANSFIQWNIDSRKQQVSGTKEFLSSELQAAKQNLEQQEQELRQFKMSHLGETPDQTATNLQVLSGLRLSLQANADSMNRFDQERILLTRLPEPITAGMDPNINLTHRGRLELEKRQLEVTIEQLRTRYSEAHPDVVKANRRLEEINSELQSLPADPIDHSSNATGKESATAVRMELIDNDMKRLKAEQDRIQSQIAAYQAKVDATPIREQQLVELTRNYDISKQHYQALLDKSFNIDMATDLEQNQKAEQFKVLDRAPVPTKPIKPKRKLLIPIGGLVAFAFSTVCVLVGKMLSPAIQTETELQALLPAGVHLMGQIPHIGVAADARRQWQLAIFAFSICVILCLALIGVVWEIRPLL